MYKNKQCSNKNKNNNNQHNINKKTYKIIYNMIRRRVIK